MPSKTTETLGLSQYIGSDKPTYLGDYNGDMKTIDNAVAALRAADESLSEEIAKKLARPTGEPAQVLNGQGEAVGITDDVTLDSPISAMFFKIAHPVWDVIETTSNRNPGSYFQTTASTADTYTGICGTWEKYGRGLVLVGEGASDATYSVTGNNVKQGGASNVIMTAAQLPVHKHSIIGGATQTPNPLGGASYLENGWIPAISGYSYADSITATGENQPHENMPPYIVVYRWRRIA